MSKLTPEAQAELDAFAEHVHWHQSGVEGCRFCLERAVKRLTVPTPASKSDTGGPMPDARREGMTAEVVTLQEFVALRHRLAASQQEVERLQQREREALDAHAASFGALAAISRLTALGGEVDEYDDVTKAVEAALAAAREDSAIVDAIERRDLTIEQMGTTVEYVNVYGPRGFRSTAGGENQGKPLRQLIRETMKSTPTGERNG